MLIIYLIGVVITLVYLIYYVVQPPYPITISDILEIIVLSLGSWIGLLISIHETTEYFKWLEKILWTPNKKLNGR